VGGGIALAVIAAIAIIYMQFIAAPAPPEATAATDETPITLYWNLLLVGVVAAIAGFVIGRRPGPHGSRAVHAGRTSTIHTSRQGSLRSGSPWTTKVAPSTMS
jgi:hypothetical protein